MTNTASPEITTEVEAEAEATAHGTTTGAGSTVVDRLLRAIEAGAGLPTDLFRADAELDATVPGWRFPVLGADAIAAELGRWYADPGHFEQVDRTPLPDGELVELTLTWTEGGVPHAVHQIHRLFVADDRIVADHAWCGGRRPAGLLAEMEAASMATRS